jgi:SIT4-associating protein SAP185/190
MFWRFGGYASISTVDSLLDKPNVTLEELLDDPEVTQELKQHNTKLIEYLREDNVLRRLMGYVIAPSLITDDGEGEDDDDNKGTAERERAKSGDPDAKNSLSDEEESIKGEKQEKPHDEPLSREDLEKAEKQRLKYSYVSCEILSSEAWSIIESMMLNEAYLRQFWEFLKSSAPLDSLQAGILQHVDNPMVMDLLLKIISMDRVSGGEGTVEVRLFSLDPRKVGANHRHSG